MKKITLLLFLALATTFGDAQNLITNGTFDDATGWTIINLYEAANTLGSGTIANGVVKFEETAAGDWKHMAIYQAVTLEVGTYQFDMDMTFTDIDAIWGEVYIGTTQPAENGGDYNGDLKVVNAFNGWDCAKTYSGSVTAGGCDDATNPGQFDITTAGTYYILFRTGGAQYGAEGIVLDNWSLTSRTLSTQDFQIEGLAVYPNPTNNYWNISTNNQVINSIEVFNILGKRELALQPNALSAKVDASNLTSGIYITKISTALGTVSKKLIKH